MKVKTRSNQIEEVDFNKVLLRLKDLHSRRGFTSKVSVEMLAKETISQMYDGISTQELDMHSARISASYGSVHYSYLDFAGNVLADNLQKENPLGFSATTEAIARMQDHQGRPLDLLDERYLGFVRAHAARLDAAVVDDRDFLFDFVGLQTLLKSYLIRDTVSNRTLERPQHLFMRVAVFLNQADATLARAVETYELLSQGFYTHATPTLFNAGLRNPQLASCFLLGVDDTIEDIFRKVSDCALISKWSGGIGLHVTNVRAKGTLIRGTNGTSNGIIPMLQVFHTTGRYVDQGGGKRKGSIAAYLEPWHADVLDFLDLRTNVGDENRKARDLFTALWVPDLFMQRVLSDGSWSLMCPTECPGLTDAYGEDFDRLYTGYERSGCARRVVKARALLRKVMESQLETGTPYVCFKDAVNRKSNQSNVGTVRGSNLCAEITEVAGSDQYAVCNLASINLSKFVTGTSSFDHEGLRRVAYLATRNLDRVIDLTYYPCPETERSNLQNRPVGLGVQGLANVFLALNLSFDGEEARLLNRRIFESIYLGAVRASVDLAREAGRPYPNFEGSPFSRGLLQFDLWGATPEEGALWEELKAGVRQHGTRNSLLTAVMPTATTAQILGNYECVEPMHSNIFVKRVLAGQFTVVNRFLVKDLEALGLWDEATKNAIVRDNGSVQGLGNLPPWLKEKYRTAWEIPQRALLDMAADRGPFVDQSQSLNVFLDKPDFQRLFNILVHGWKLGLKTGVYYVRSKPAATATKFSSCASCSA